MQQRVNVSWRQKETQTKEKEVDLKGMKGGSVVKWTKPLKL